MEVFGAEWTRAWAVEINRDPTLREAGRGWHDAIVLRMWPEPGFEGRALYVHLENGECREARAALDADTSSAPYVIGGPPSTWRSVLEGEVEPIRGLMEGRLRLERGNLLRLVPWARAAKALLAAAARVPGRFPDDANVVDGAVVPGTGVTGDDGASGGSGGGHTSAARAGGRGPFRRLDGELVPMRLWQKAKKLGIWDPRDIGLNTDREDWGRLAEPQRDLLLRLAVQFRCGESALTSGILSLLAAIAQDGRTEEGMYLTSFLWEESKHIEMFDRFVSEVAPRTDLAAFVTPAWRRIFEDELQSDMRALSEDGTAVAQVRAAVTCHLVIEGILGETAHHAFHLILERSGILPGMQRAIQYIKRDESRHVQWGSYLVGRLVAENGDVVWKSAEARLAELLEPSLTLMRSVFDAYEKPPFGLDPDALLAHANTAFRNRLARLEATRHATLAELLHSSVD